jgi:hypothetical protein
MNEKEKTFEMRILLAFEKKHTTHMDAVRTAIQGCLLDAEVRVIDPEALKEEAERFDPHLIVCEGSITENSDGKVPARIELSIEPAQPSRFRVGQRCWESLNPGLSDLQATVVETERLISSAS